MLPGLTTRRSVSTPILDYPRAELDFDLATIVAELQTRGGRKGNSARSRFVAHHACVLLGLLCARHQVVEGLEAGSSDDEGPPAPPAKEEMYNALIEGTRTLSVVLDAITRSAHTKKFTIQQNRQVFQEAVRVLAKFDDDDDLEALLSPSHRGGGANRRVRFRKEAAVAGAAAGGQAQPQVNKTLCLFLQENRQNGQVESTISKEALDMLVQNQPTNINTVFSDGAELRFTLRGP